MEGVKGGVYVHGCWWFVFESVCYGVCDSLWDVCDGVYDVCVIRLVKKRKMSQKNFAHSKAASVGS